MTANSSPPKRAKTSSARSVRPAIAVRWRKTSSPAGWPCVSLTRLKWSRSSKIKAQSVAWRTANAISARRRSSKWRRLYAPVSASRVLESYSLRSRLSWRVSVSAKRNATRAPSCTQSSSLIATRVMRLPWMKVPLREPRSSTKYSPFSQVKRA